MCCRPGGFDSYPHNLETVSTDLPPRSNRDGIGQMNQTPRARSLNQRATSHHPPTHDLRIRRLVAPILAFGMLVTACAADPIETVEAFDSVEAIETNDGAIAVKPPDVLDGEPEAPADVTVATTVPIQPDTADGNPDGDADAASGASETGLLSIPQNEFVWFDGRPGSTDEFAGKPTVLNFWSSNCAACVAEMPDFEEVFQELGGRVAFVGMNRDDTREFALQLAEETGVTYPLAEDIDSKMFIDFRAFAMPTTVFLTADNEVAYIWQGGLTGEDLLLLVDQHLQPGNGAT